MAIIPISSLSIYLIMMRYRNSDLSLSHLLISFLLSAATFSFSAFYYSLFTSTFLSFSGFYWVFFCSIFRSYSNLNTEFLLDSCNDIFPSSFLEHSSLNITVPSHDLSIWLTCLSFLESILNPPFYNNSAFLNLNPPFKNRNFRLLF